MLDHNTNPVLITCASVKKFTFMGDLKKALAVHFNFPLRCFSLYITVKSGIATAGETIPTE